MGYCRLDEYEIEISRPCRVLSKRLTTRQGSVVCRHEHRWICCALAAGVQECYSRTDRNTI